MFDGLKAIDQMLASGSKTIHERGNEFIRKLSPKDFSDLATARLRLQEAIRITTGESEVDKLQVARASRGTGAIAFYKGSRRACRRDG